MRHKYLIHWSLAYMIIGLLSGFYTRELAKGAGFSGETVLTAVHGHFLVLGMFFFLIVFMLDLQLHITQSRLFSWFLWIYNLGLILSGTMILIRGTLDVKVSILIRSLDMSVAGMSGIGHMLLTIGLVLFFVILYQRIPQNHP